MSWSVIIITPGFEQKIKNTIESSQVLKNINKRILIPSVQKKGYINGKLHFYLEKLFPGYVFVECNKNDYNQLFSYLSGLSYVLNMSSIKNIKRISYNIEDIEILEVLKLMGGEDEKKERELEKNFQINDKVKITSGPFSNFEGVIKEINKVNAGETKIKVAARLFNNDLTFIIVSHFQVELV